MSLIPLILVIIVNLIPGEVSKFSIQTKGSHASDTIEFMNQADARWKVSSGKTPDDWKGIFYIEGTKLTRIVGGKTNTQDMEKLLTLGATPFKIEHRARGLNLQSINAEGKLGKAFEIRWESKRSQKCMH